MVNIANESSLGSNFGNDDFERIVFIRNPVSRNTLVMSKTAELLEEEFGKRFTQIETQPEWQRTEEQLEREIKGGELIVTGTGDGVSSRIMQIQLAHPWRSETATLPILGGGSNDMAHQLNPYLMHNNVSRIIREGKVIDFHPMELTIDPPEGKQETIIAAYIASFGWTALSAKNLNDENFRVKMLKQAIRYQNFPEVFKYAATEVSDLRVVMGALRHSRSFNISDQNGEREIFDLIVANGKRAAKHGRFAVSLVDSAFQSLELTKDYRQLAPILGRYALRRQLPAKPTNSLEFTVTNPTGEPIPAEYDGEHIEIESGSNVEIKHLPVAIRALTTDPDLIAKRF